MEVAAGITSAGGNGVTVGVATGVRTAPAISPPPFMVSLTTAGVEVMAGIGGTAEVGAGSKFKSLVICIKGWVTVENNAGTIYPDAKLKLVAGDINRVYPPQPYYEKAGYAVPVAIPTPWVGAPPGFTQAGLFEYHLYTLQRPTTLNNNEIKQISLLSADNVPAKKEYSYDGAKDGEKVRVILNITNSKENNLGMPLPKGVVRVYKADSDGQLQFLGEDSIDHTPKDEKLRINIGNAFDIVGKRTVIDREGLGSYGNRETYSIELKNHKNEDAKIIVTEHFYGNWQITKASENYTKKDANTIEFKVNVPNDGTKTITYTVETRYQ